MYPSCESEGKLAESKPNRGKCAFVVTSYVLHQKAEAKEINRCSKWKQFRVLKN